MTRIDFGGAMLALLMGFILSAGVTAFLLPASGMMFPMPMPMMTGPGMVAPAAQARLPLRFRLRPPLPRSRSRWWQRT